MDIIRKARIERERNVAVGEMVRVEIAVVSVISAVVGVRGLTGDEFWRVLRVVEEVEGGMSVGLRSVRRLILWYICVYNEGEKNKRMRKNEQETRRGKEKKKVSNKSQSMTNRLEHIPSTLHRHILSREMLKEHPKGFARVFDVGHKICVNSWDADVKRC